MSETSAMMAAADRLLDAADSTGLILRLCGGLACWYRCDSARGVAERFGRKYRDIDFVGYYRQKSQIITLLRSHGYQEDAITATVPGLRRTIFRNDRAGLRGDVFYDSLTFCHMIDLRQRLERTYRTLSLADLLLQKLQIVELTAKDVVDTQMLLLAFEFSPDDEGINRTRVAEVCGANWGFYHTVQLNVERLTGATSAASYLDQAERDRVCGQLEFLSNWLENARKSLPWRVRSLLGDRVRWYATVDEQ